MGSVGSNVETLQTARLRDGDRLFGGWSHQQSTTNYQQITNDN